MSFTQSALNTRGWFLPTWSFLFCTPHHFFQLQLRIPYQQLTLNPDHLSYPVKISDFNHGMNPFIAAALRANNISTTRTTPIPHEDIALTTSTKDTRMAIGSIVNIEDVPPKHSKEFQGRQIFESISGSDATYPRSSNNVSASQANARPRATGIMA